MKKVLKIALWSLVALIFVGTFVYLFLNSRPKEVTYELVQPVTGNIERSTVLTGKIEPRDEIDIKPQISGIISEILVEAGDQINEGDVIAKIKVVPQEGELASALSRVNTAKINLEDVKSKHERNTMLYQNKVISREEYETSQTSLAQAREELKAAQDAYSIVKDGMSADNAKSSNTLVRATITGLVLDVPVKVGSSVIQANTMNDGTTVATLADMNKLIFKGKMDETEVGRLHVGMPMEISIGALPDYKSTAVIEYISPKATEENGANSFEVKGSIATDGKTQLRSGYSANATVILQGATNVMTLPESVIEYEGNKTFVYVAADTLPPYNFKRTPVEVGVSDGLNVEIKSGVKAGQRIRGEEKSDKNDNPSRPPMH